MEKFNKDSFCGISCGACEIMYAYKNDTKNKIAAKWGALPEEVKCLGCKTQTVFKNCNLCKIRKCALKKGVDHCVTCKDFPCETLNSGESLVEHLPHLKAIPQNMKTIMEKGSEYWLKQQDKKWRCSSCGTSFSWYQQKCSNCGKDISKDKDYLNLDIS